MLKFYNIKTFGCQMNEHDSSKIGLLLEGMGCVSTNDPFKASIIVYNTCSVREKAHHKAISEVGRARLYKKKRKDAIIVVCGCVAQQEGAALIERFPHVDYVVGPDEISRLPRLISSGDDRVAVRLINDPDDYQFINVTPKLGRVVSAYVTIMKGCNNACSFCIVPSVRGREVSRTPDEIVEEIRALTDIGVKEVILLGQNVNSYPDFSGLLRRISVETKISRIRFTSPHPKDLSRRLMMEYAENPKLCPHMHLPVQAGSNRMLRLMNRGYTREDFIEKADALRSLRPGISITTDMIIGFPAETDADFEETLSLMRQVKFEGMFVFKYSPRPGTLAAKRYEDDVPVNVKEDRLKRVLLLNESITLKKYKSYVGSIQDVLVEGISKKGNGQMTGRAPTNHIINFPGDFVQVGDILPVKITKADKNSLSGELV